MVIGRPLLVAYSLKSKITQANSLTHTILMVNPEVVTPGMNHKNAIKNGYQ